MHIVHNMGKFEIKCQLMDTLKTFSVLFDLKFDLNIDTPLILPQSSIQFTFHYVSAIDAQTEYCAKNARNIHNM